MNVRTDLEDLKGHLKSLPKAIVSETGFRKLASTPTYQKWEKDAYKQNELGDLDVIKDRFEEYLDGSSGNIGVIPDYEFEKQVNDWECYEYLPPDYILVKYKFSCKKCKNELYYECDTDKGFFVWNYIKCKKCDTTYKVRVDAARFLDVSIKSEG